jgi:hypothetical protein
MQASAFALAPGVLEQRAQVCLYWCHVGLEACPVLVLVLVGAPRCEHAVGESMFAKGLLLDESFAVTTEVALQVRPTDLLLVRVEMLVAGPAV